jgi:hypothetical protein
MENILSLEDATKVPRPSQVVLSGSAFKAVSPPKSGIERLSHSSYVSLYPYPWQSSHWRASCVILRQKLGRNPINNPAT